MAARDLEECPECGASFKRGRLACPECGSDAQTGWKSEDELQYQSIEIPDSYEELLASGAPKRPKNWVLIAALVALTAFLIAILVRGV